MTNASAVSPFAGLTEDDYWFLWQKQSPVLSLQDHEQTDGRSVFEPESPSYVEHTSSEMPQHLSVPVIQRNQYNAVLSRFDQASKRVGNFSAWNT